MFTHIAKRCRAFFATFALLAAGSACAVNISGNFNNAGYAIYNFTLSAPSTVAFKSTGGYFDPSISLFDASGAHLATDDDDYLTLWSNLTQNLAAGSYAILISYCCNAYGYVANHGATQDIWDGFEFGTFYFGGTATLAGISTYLDGFNFASQQPYALTMTETAIPEPAGLTLLALGLACLGLSRHKPA